LRYLQERSQGKFFDYATTEFPGWKVADGGEGTFYFPSKLKSLPGFPNKMTNCCVK